MISFFFELWQLLSCCIEALELYSIHRRNIGASVIEINEGISDLLDKQVDTEDENKNSRVHASPRKVCKRRNDCCANFY